MIEFFHLFMHDARVFVMVSLVALAFAVIMFFAWRAGHDPSP